MVARIVSYRVVPCRIVSESGQGGSGKWDDRRTIVPKSLLQGAGAEGFSFQHFHFRPKMSLQELERLSNKFYTAQKAEATIRMVHQYVFNFRDESLLDSQLKSLRDFERLLW